MLVAVTALMSMMRRNRFHSGIAALVCSLVLVFAVGAKVAWYHSSDQSVKPIASAKMWQTPKAAPSEDEKASVAAGPVILLVLLVEFLIADEILLRPRHTRVPQARFAGFPPLAVRPPPAL